MKLIFLIILSFFTAGCDLFSTREAEEPGTGRSNFRPATTPEIVIENLINSFADKNIENYLYCLVDSNFSGKKFWFIASAGASSQFPDLVDNWDKKDEEQYFTNVISRVAQNLPVTLSFNNSQFSPQGDSITFSSAYSINVPVDDQDISNNYQGELIFTIIRDNSSIWRIYFWQDIKNSDLPSWSELKGRFY